ncbi:cytochrome-c peroxidase [Magnetovibrio blakemorei]|uniref:Methylamine utilization protein MauG n=1 Tax=Magnetovibrio blakemorei TaxID=28181 RepID=A0A1E5Q897_9PROT|nr:cytochrome c peroxidase [Magnetovibrio blakemorei]OEJ67371.1 hypothetical protein BEN30_09575 [Magnetovibrio blakemorei]
MLAIVGCGSALGTVDGAELTITSFDQNAVQRAHNPPLGLPSLPKSVLAAITPEKVSLGRKLFFDRRLSHNGTISCAMCHVPEQGFTVNEIATAVGMEGRTVRRNAPTILNAAYYTTMFHDGRDPDLEHQVFGPLTSRVEMSNPSLGYVIETIRHTKDYDGLFEQAYNAPVSLDVLGDAIAVYERTVLSANSPFDRWYFGNEEDAVSQEVKAGFNLFVSKGGCVACHTIDGDHALFTDNAFHNTGVGYFNTFGPQEGDVEVYLAPGVSGTVTRAAINAVGQEKPEDIGRYEVTLDTHDRWKYKTPMLRNVAKTAPYMHEGSLRTLEDVVKFYNQGGLKNPGLDEKLKPLGMTTQEQRALVRFLESLTGDNIEALIADARSTKVGNPTH